MLDGDAADVLLVAARTPDGIGLFEVDPRQDGVARAAVTAMDATRGLAVVRLTRCAGRRVGGDAAGALARARDLACIALSAEQVGAAQRALELTVGYALTRVQFGQVDRRLPGPPAPAGRPARPGRVGPVAVRRGAAADRPTGAGPDLGAARRGRRQGLLLRGADPDGGRDDPAARRHRHHLGAPGPPLPQARARRPGTCSASPARHAAAIAASLLDQANLLDQQ